MLTSHDEYLAQCPDVHRAALQDLRRRIADRLPGAEEVISYQMPAFRVEGGHIAAGYASWALHMALYPFSGTVLPEIEDELQGWRHTKSALHFTADRLVTDAILNRMLETRLGEIGHLRRTEWE